MKNPRSRPLFGQHKDPNAKGTKPIDIAVALDDFATTVRSNTSGDRTDNDNTLNYLEIPGKADNNTGDLEYLELPVIDYSGNYRNRVQNTLVQASIEDQVIKSKPSANECIDFLEKHDPQRLAYCRKKSSETGETIRQYIMRNLVGYYYSEDRISLISIRGDIGKNTVLFNFSDISEWNYMTPATNGKIPKNLTFIGWGLDPSIKRLLD